MRIERKDFETNCTIYDDKAHITIEFLVEDSLERSPDDYAPNKILSCSCGKKHNCSRKRHECPVWLNAKW